MQVGYALVRTVYLTCILTVSLVVIHSSYLSIVTDCKNECQHWCDFCIVYLAQVFPSPSSCLCLCLPLGYISVWALVCPYYSQDPLGAWASGVIQLNLKKEKYIFKIKITKIVYWSSKERRRQHSMLQFIDAYYLGNCFFVGIWVLVVGCPLSDPQVLKYK